MLIFRSIKKRDLFNSTITALSVIVFLILFEIVGIVFNSPFIPRLEKIIIRFSKELSSKVYWEDILETIKAVLIGDFIAIVLGYITGVLQSLSKTIDKMLFPILSLLKNIPPIALFPILIMIGGMTIWSRVLGMFVVVYYTVANSTYMAIKNVPELVINASKFDYCNKWRTMLKIQIPMSLPDVLGGITNSVVASFFSICGIEMLGYGRGIGYRILFYSNTMDFIGCYVYIITIAVMGLMISIALRYMQQLLNRRIFGKYEKQ